MVYFVSCSQFLTILFLLKEASLVFSEVTDNEIVEKIVDAKHLRVDGFSSFELADIHEIFKGTKERISKDYLHRRRRESLSPNSTLDLEFTAFNKTFRIHVQYNPALISPHLLVSTRRGGSRETWQGEVPDCFLEGFTDNKGVVSLAYCNGLTGSVTEGTEMYRIDPVGPLFNNHESVLISKADLTQMRGDGAIDDTYIANELSGRGGGRQRRAIPSTSFTVELGVYMDAPMYAVLEERYTAHTVEEKIYMVALKFNGVQAMYNLMPADLGYTVTLQIKAIEFWQTDPIKAEEIWQTDPSEHGSRPGPKLFSARLWNYGTRR
ncbi:ATS18-like protein [Mya arenaria]|uniref:ATS18-like protein n=1 Tax=Mya arenaria TaxID=6604 RepID=A0ABY7G2V3_MYAAR|nr:ATS18-like protein [Mya arenaria]